MRQRVRIGEALLAAMREDIPATRSHIGGVDPNRIATAARYHGAAGYLYAAIREPGCDPSIVDAVATAYHFGLGVAMRALADLAWAAPVLDAHDIPWLVVKGPVLAERLYPEPGLRAYNDLDLVVPAGSFERAVDALTTAGDLVIDRNWRLLRREMRGQLHLQLRHGTLADLHWHLINRDRVPFAIAMEEIFQRARTVDVDGLPVRTPDASDTLLHLCLHAYLAGGNKLVWLKDIERAIAADPPDWDAIVARARSWRAGLPVATMLARSRRILGAAIPDDVPEALGAPVRRRLDRLAANAVHAERSKSGRGAAALPARLLARTPVTSALVYARRSVTRIRSRGAHPIDRILVASGDDGDRRAFLDGVARSAGPRDRSPSP